jgi:iron(III) transport system ATP-binding protein
VLEAVGVCQRYDADPVLQDIGFTLAEGRIGCLLGGSGCGKTTLLRCIAGFEHIGAGRITLAGRLLSGPGVHVAPEDREVGMVFQEHALLPHLDVRGNIAFGLHGLAAGERAARVESLLDTVGLGDLAGRLPHELSGGQQQRVALARSLARRPRLLLLDEPFSNLDYSLRQRLGAEIRELLLSLGITALLVTHDREEAFALADDIGVMSQGRLRQWATAYDIYHEPATREVADFVGGGAWIAGTVRASDTVETAAGLLRGRLTRQLPPGSPVDVLLRPDDVVLADDGAVSARVTGKRFRGAIFLYDLRLADGTPIVAAVRSHHNHPVGSTIQLRFETDHMVVFARGASAGAEPAPQQVQE